MQPFHQIQINLAGPWKVFIQLDHRQIAKQKWIFTILDSCANWIEYHSITNKKSTNIAKIFDNKWLCCYLQPHFVIFDTGGEFTGFEFQKLLQSYRIQAKPTLIKNPQLNSFKRIQLSLADHLQGKIFQGEEPWEQQLHSTLQSIAWAIRSTIHSIANHSPAQLDFNKNMIVQMLINIDWEKIKCRCMEATKTNHLWENKNRIKFEYQIGEQILIVSKRPERTMQQKLQSPMEGPYLITNVFKSGTVEIDRKGHLERINIERINFGKL